MALMLMASSFLEPLIQHLLHMAHEFTRLELLRLAEYLLVVIASNLEELLPVDPLHWGVHWIKRIRRIHLAISEARLIKLSSGVEPVAVGLRELIK